MSNELHVFLAGEFPTRAAWQSAIDKLGFPFQLDPDLDLEKDSGFSPSLLRGKDSGFEICFEEAAELLQTYPNIKGKIEGREKVISFRWGGDLNECACVMAAAAGLVECCQALVYFPQDDCWYEASELRKEFDGCS